MDEVGVVYRQVPQLNPREAEGREGGRKTKIGTENWNVFW